MKKLQMSACFQFLLTGTISLKMWPRSHFAVVVKEECFSLMMVSPLGGPTCGNAANMQQ